MQQVLKTMLENVRAKTPLVHNITNYVTVNDVANVLLAAGGSPIMSDDADDVEDITSICGGLNINIGTLNKNTIPSMFLAGKKANELGHIVLLDPVGAGGTAWRDDLISDLIDLRPTVIRGNGSEILACAGFAHQYKGVDSLDSSRSALDAAKALAQRSGGIVCVSGETDYATDGTRVLAAVGGNVMATLVVGTGCSLSALTAGFAAKAEDPLVATIACCQFVKRAAEIAGNASRGPGSFHDAYLDALYTLQPENFLEEAV